MRTLVLAAVAISSVLVGCRSGGSDSPTSTAVSEDEYRFIAATIANAVLVTDGDLPDEFAPVAEDPADNESPDPVFSFTRECEEFEPYFNIEADWLSSAAEVEGAEFEDPAENNVSSDAAVFVDEAGMGEELELLDDLLATCGDQLESSFEAYYRELAADAGNTLTNANVEFSKLPDPDRGDWSRATRLNIAYNINGTDVKVIVDTVEVSVGRILGATEYTHSGSANETLQLRLVDAMVERMRFSNARLADIGAPAPRTGSEFKLAAARAMGAVRLDDADLPENWDAESSSVESNITDLFGSDCYQFEDGAIATVVSSDLKSFRDVLGSIAHVHETEDAARAKADAFDLNLDRCAEQFRVSIEQGFRKSFAEEGRDVTVSAVLEPVEPFGGTDWFRASRVSWRFSAGVTVRGVVYFAVLREGRFLAAIGYVDQDDANPEIFQSAVETISVRLRDQDADLAPPDQ